MGMILEIIKSILVSCWVSIVTIASVIVIITELIPASEDEWRKIVMAFITLLAVIGMFVIMYLMLKEEKTKKR
jgi:TRAP-type uncharacterized transport system fused permease subunit